MNNWIDQMDRGEVRELLEDVWQHFHGGNAYERERRRRKYAYFLLSRFPIFMRVRREDAPHVRLIFGDEVLDHIQNTGSAEQWYPSDQSFGLRAHLIPLVMHRNGWDTDE